MKRKITKKDYHRNGICGEGFHVGIIRDEDGSKKLFVTFPEYDMEVINEEERVIEGNCRTAILDLKLLKDEVIEFMENGWRGDHYHTQIIEAINE
jgi:hypothetical protein